MWDPWIEIKRGFDISRGLNYVHRVSSITRASSKPQSVVEVVANES